MAEKRFRKIDNIRFTVTDEETKETLWSRQFTRINLIITLITAVVVAFAFCFAVLAFTPLKTLIPGYPDARTKHEAIENAIRIDSLETMITRWELYSENLRRVVDGQEPLKIDSLLAAQKAKEDKEMKAEEIAKKDSLLKKEVTSGDNSDAASAPKGPLPIEGMHFFAPVKGVISQSYNKASHPYIDISAAEGASVLSVLDGTVISAGWSDEDGYTVRIQHEGDIISVYRDTEKLTKKTGDKVTAGMPVAIAGEGSKGAYVRFELWYKGEAVDPTKYINF